MTNSSNPGGTANRITSFGLGIDPDATGSLTFISGTDALSNFDTSNLSGFQLVEFCATSGANCSGGGSGGLKSGQEDIFQFNLVDGFVEGGTIDLSQFGFKFQGGATSYEIPGCIGIDCDRTPPTQVPTPTALALLSAGILAFSFVGRRRLTAGRSR